MGLQESGCSEKELVIELKAVWGRGGTGHTCLYLGSGLWQRGHQKETTAAVGHRRDAARI